MLGRRGDGEREAGAKMCPESPKIIDSGRGGNEGKISAPSLGSPAASGVPAPPEMRRTARSEAPGFSRTAATLGR